MESQRTNELLEKLIIATLHHQGVGRDQIARFLGKRGQWVGEQTKLLKRGRENDSAN